MVEPVLGKEWSGACLLYTSGLEGFPASEAAEDNALSIPLYPGLADGEVAQIIMAMRDEWRRE